jgi:hypothetical protein
MNRHAVGMGAIAAAVMLLATGGLALAADDANVRSADGHLMPVRKGQLPPDLRYFEQTQK